MDDFQISGLGDWVAGLVNDKLGQMELERMSLASGLPSFSHRWHATPRQKPLQAARYQGLGFKRKFLAFSFRFPFYLSDYLKIIYNIKCKVFTMAFNIYHDLKYLFLLVSYLTVYSMHPAARTMFFHQFSFHAYAVSFLLNPHFLFRENPTHLSRPSLPAGPFHKAFDYLLYLN